jgi:hypothetical protein
MLVGTTNLNTTLNLTYVLTDVVETLLYDLRSEMGKQGYELRKTQLQHCDSSNS